MPQKICIHSHTRRSYTDNITKWFRKCRIVHYQDNKTEIANNVHKKCHNFACAWTCAPNKRWNQIHFVSQSTSAAIAYTRLKDVLVLTLPYIIVVVFRWGATLPTCICRQVVSIRWLYKKKMATFTSPLSGIGVSLSLSPLSLGSEDRQMNNWVFQEPKCKLEGSTKFISSHWGQNLKEVAPDQQHNQDRH
jgi:hypothetical protein